VEFSNMLVLSDILWMSAPQKSTLRFMTGEDVLEVSNRSCSFT